MLEAPGVVLYIEKERSIEYVHTCYRVLDLGRSLDFYTEKLGLELARKSPVGDDATNAFLAVYPATLSPGWSSPSTTTAKSPTLWVEVTVTSPSPSKTSTL